MPRKICLMVLSVFLLCSLLGCLHHTKITARQSVAFYAYPIDMTNDSHSTKVEIIETDSYGRNLLWLQVVSLSDRDISKNVFVILQKYTKDAVFFYEDIGWRNAEIDDEERQLWKKNNDWDQPLQEEKMSCRKCHTTFDGYIQEDGEKIPYKTVKKFFKEYRNTSPEFTSYSFIDYDENGKELWLVRYESEGGATEKKYIIISKDTGISEGSLLVSEALADWRKLTQFKYENGWHYPEALIEQLLQMF